jgi:hypothetical protein
VDPLHRLSRQLEGFAAAADGAAARSIKSSEAVPDSQNLVRRDAVVREGEDDVLDDVVEPCCCMEVEGRESSSIFLIFLFVLLVKRALEK